MKMSMPVRWQMFKVALEMAVTRSLFFTLGVLVPAALLSLFFDIVPLTYLLWAVFIFGRFLLELYWSWRKIKQTVQMIAQTPSVKVEGVTV